ncbi:tetratricopeptide repeat protein [Microcoleus sp. bin38.metabat.b11b12b14.051]|uniref:tetratricopeptide repeat protein n=1 Tax=Microcoleus sp. bin38.metabat.b11b12b14.051 TaxID=2742709 RepID=UPI0025FF4A2E|nr:tetratricopeptide repeat protein [Microcoleus sp. bin38.metabat.b11b12b14.051]
MKILHLDLKTVQGDYVEFRYFLDNPNNYNSPRRLSLTEIADLIQLVERDYYVPLPEDYAVTGKCLFDWLDGTERLFSRKLHELAGESVILAISAAERLAHLPWELLHDDSSFLVAKRQPIIPTRWVSSDSVKKLSVDEAKPENRALNLLFMAASPVGAKSVLDFEKEEGLILTATAKQPLALVVEESGCLTELGDLIDSHDQGYFDAFHLSGHATINDGKPRFYTETETGETYLASGEDIARSFKSRIPKLLFLSGCRTGQSGKAGSVPCLAEELLSFGAKAVLGWGKKVADEDATAAAAKLYSSLAAGYELTEALAKTYQALIANQARDWHLLRLYVAGTLPGNLVTTLQTRGRKRAPKPTVREQFLDAAGQQVKVPTREAFVGRRRQIQSCLKALKLPSDLSGVLIHGMGGLGKSSLASRLCDRLTDFERIVWSGKVDERSLLIKLGDKLSQSQREHLQRDDDEELKYRLRNLFSALEEGELKPFLLVLDDFETHLESRPNSGYVLQPEMAKILDAWVWAIKETNAPHRLILTCRYDFDSRLLRDFYKQGLDGFKDADLLKKCSWLKAFAPKSQVDRELRLQAQNLADGNPRLLERLDLVLLAEKLDVSAILARMQQKTAEFRENILNEELLKQISPELKSMLELALVYQLPVPREAIAAVCTSIVEIEKIIDRAIALGLLEVSPDSSLRVPRILSLNLPEESAGLHREAAEFLYRLWWEEAEYSTEEKGLEIHRLALLGKVEKIAVKIADIVTSRWKNQSRFREAVKTCEDTLAVFPDYRIFHSLARSEAQLGNTDAAKKYYEQALDECPPEDERVKAAIIHNLAGIYANQGDVEEAIALYQQSLELDEKIGDVQGKAASLHQLAIIYADRGDVDEAITLYQQCLEIDEKIGNVQGKAASLHNLAIIYANRGDVEKAIALYQQSLELEEKIGNVQGKAASLHCLAGIYANRGDVDEAIALYQQSLELKEKIGDVQGKAASLHCLAGIYANRGDVDEAIALYQQSLELEEKIGDVQGKAASLHNLAIIYANRGDVEKAIALYQQSLELKEKIGNVQGKAASLHCLAGIYANRGDVDEAIALYQQSLELKEKIGDVQGKAASLHCLAGIYANRGDVDEAIALYQQSLELKEKIGNVQGKAATFAMLGQLLASRGDFEQALNYLQQSLEILQHLRSPDAETVKEIIADVQQMADG